MSRLENAIEKALKARSTEVVPKKWVVGSDAKVAASPLQEEIFPDSSRPQSDLLLTVEPLKLSNPNLLVNRADSAFLTEEYRKLKTVVVQKTAGEKFRNTLMVTSTVSGEGKSLTTLNLAICLAQELDHTVLVVDTDLRQPSVHEYLGIPAGPGLVQCLTEDCPLEKALIKTGIGKLVVLPAGGRVANPVELLSSKRMKEVVRELKERYPDRYVLFDSTPFLAFAESQSLATVMDGILFVIREGKANINQVKLALETLKKIGNLLGVVYNDSHLVSKHDEYYYSYPKEG
ncbi:MAG: polysaccharide biosynthesis tyrosine autokinase [Deltaproteobacteria bacterium]|nr:polysaccharide biosynthesis tyrosine autokinase [Deltaproteobacteria bacterium]